jgi:hypothetical protein
MAEQEDDELFDDFEVEITSLDGHSNASRPKLPRGLHLFTRQKRKSSLAITGALFLLVVFALLASIPDVRGLVTRAVLRPAQTATTNGLRLYLTGNPSWGAFTLDGIARPHLPLIGQNAPLVLSYGSHQITWQAAPFQAHHCELLVINSSTVAGSCTHDKEVSLGYIPNTSALLVSFFASLNDLPQTQRASLIAQMQTALEAEGGEDTVYPGEVYAASDQDIRAHPSLCPIVVRITLCYARANQPLIAHLNIQTDTSNTSDDPCILSQLCYFDHLDCRVLCPNFPVVFSGQATDGWNVLIPLRLLWSYTTPTGTSVATNQPDTALSGVPTYQLSALYITRDTQRWVISPFVSSVPTNSTDPLCGQAEQDTTELVNTLTNTNQSVAITQWSDLQTNLASGCLEVAEPTAGVFSTPTPTPGSQKSPLAYCLFRFGVVLAANAVAHQLWPYLPLADSYEQGIAQRLYSLLPL